MAIKHAAFGTALGAGGQYILLADLIQEGVFRQHGQRGKAANHQRNGGQHHMPGVIQNARAKRPGLRSWAVQPAQREPLEEGTAGEKHHQYNREQKAWYGIANQHHRRCRDIKARSIAHRFPDAKRDRDQVNQQCGPKAKRNGYWHFFDNQINHRPIPKQ